MGLFSFLKSNKNKKLEKNKNIENNNKNLKNLKNIKEEVIGMQLNIDSNEDKFKDDYFNSDFIDAAVNEIDLKQNPINKNADIKNNTENYEELLEELKRKNINNINSNNINPTNINSNKDNLNSLNEKPQNIDLKNNFYESEIDKIKIFLPKSDRYKNVDVYKLKQKIYYENTRHDGYDRIKSEELQKKYSNEIPLGDAENIWKWNQQKKASESNSNKSSIQQQQNVINSDKLEDYFKYKNNKNSIEQNRHHTEQLEDYLKYKNNKK